jgi:alkylation response protein AidB-like acyl-CoA dehydrogenase
VLKPASITLDKLADPEDVIREGSVYWDVFRKYHELGRHLAAFPEELGGANLRGLESHIVSEEMGWGAADFAIGLGASGSPFNMGLLAATMLGKQRLMDDVVLPYVHDKEAKYIGCWAITEPQHGSDCAMAFMPEHATNPQTSFDTCQTRRRRLGHQRRQVGLGLQRHRRHPCHAPLRRGPVQGNGRQRHSRRSPQPARRVEGEAPEQARAARPQPGRGLLRRRPHPERLRVVETEMYPMVGDMILAGANSGMGATFTGVARAAYEEAMAYCKQRVQGGKPICEHQLVQRKLFDMFTKVEAARYLSRAAIVYNSVTMPPVSRYSVAAKVFCTEVAFEVASDAVQLLGGYGLSKEFLVEKLFRDARASMIEDGANDVLALGGAWHLINSFQ